MKQYKITTEHLNQDSPDDCYLAPDDPTHELKALQYLAGLGSLARLHEYNGLQGSNISGTGNSKGELMKQNDIKPGTPEFIQCRFRL